MSRHQRLCDFVTAQGNRIWIEAADSGHIARLRAGAESRIITISRDEAIKLRDGLDSFLGAT